MAGTRRGAGVKSITLRLEARDGRQADVRLNPREDDAVFFTLDAVDRFLVPLYATRGELRAALKFRAEAARRLRRVDALPLHKGMCFKKLRPIRWKRPSIRK